MTSYPTAEIVAIGSELLSGDTVDTNSSHVARTLAAIGIELRFISAVVDDETLIAEAVARGLTRSDIVLTTGGLGPTIDDKTRASIANATDRSLVFRPDLLEQIRSRFARSGGSMTDNNRRQAYTPEGALPIENPVGTAPCFIVEHNHSNVICLPGVPREMTYLLQHEVTPYLRRRFPLAKVIKTRVLHTVGLGESVVDSKIGSLEELENPTVGLTAHLGVVDIRITANATDEAEADQLIAQVEAAARERLGESIFGVDGESLARLVLDRMENAGERVSVVESGTQGQLAQKLAIADDGRGVFQVGMLRPNLATARGLERTVANMANDCLQAHSTDLSVASLVVMGEDGIEIGVALGQANTGITVTNVRSFGGHIEHAGEWGAHLGLNILRTRPL